MGIKFRCPNGHKLNVKSFLAGKRGVCPKCGTSLRIPLESTRGQDPDSAADEGDGDDLLDEAKFPAPGRAAAVARAATAADPDSPARAVAIAAPAAIPVAAAADPIAEAPAAVWYVRPPGGDQYGPARGDVMRRWIGEGRVSTDSLVWREGWADWLTASEVFPSLKSAPVPPPDPPSVAIAPTKTKSPASPSAEPTSPARSSSRLSNRYESRRKQSSGLGIAVIVILGLLCVVLAVLLVYVFVFSGGTAPKAKLPARSANVGRVISNV
jgi:hypothetical protein